MSTPESITRIPADELGPFLRFCLNIPYANRLTGNDDPQLTEMVRLMIAALEADCTERWPHLVAEITGLSDLREPPVALLYAQFEFDVEQARIEPKG